MRRTTRCQAAVVEDGRMLMIRFRDPADGRTFWLVPGGGREAGETEEECVRRELREETGLEVRVERLLVEHADPTGFYPVLKTYLCRAAGGALAPGYEPGPAMPEGCGIIETGWFDLGRPETWPAEAERDPITRAILRDIGAALGQEGGGCGLRRRS